MHPDSLRFGLLGESVRSATELAETARRAEGAGFATFLLRDHFIATVRQATPNNATLGRPKGAAE
jgi:alkanesulfonate monooxygenase SsuD/methylene tetrahydromethanopterin reductase-like flavin-dependent oxidoreductase (luciferase family)